MFPQMELEQRDADDAFFIQGKMRDNSTFSIQLISGVNHAFGASLRIFGESGTITLTDDKELYFGKSKEKFNKINVSNLEITSQQLSAEARSYYPAFYPFLEKLYEYISDDKLDEDLPTIEDGHKNQVIIDKVLGN
ncbi:hypothetical protein [Oceanobacillus neutriphilus]|nr:hypothetical protein [Oceanobacillus neutriphilus]